MSNYIKVVCFIVLILSSGSTFQDQDDNKVSLTIIDREGHETVKTFDWPFRRLPSVGNKSKMEELKEKVENILEENKIDCPPRRVKISDDIWRCGNGKKIKPDDKKLIRLFKKVWPETD